MLRIVNVPNTLCAIRLLGSFVLFYLALRERARLHFLYLFIFLVFTDWIDGKLAILLHQRTEFGARLDSVADAALYTAMLFGVGWMKWDFVFANWPWLLIVTASYWLTSLAGLIKFRQNSQLSHVCGESLGASGFHCRCLFVHGVGGLAILRRRHCRDADECRGDVDDSDPAGVQGGLAVDLSRDHVSPSRFMTSGPSSPCLVRVASGESTCWTIKGKQAIRTKAKMHGGEKMAWNPVVQNCLEAGQLGASQDKHNISWQHSQLAGPPKRCPTD